MDARARTNPAPVSTSARCPACSKPVDALRAGQVAILDGAFRYFCDAACKSAYVDAVSKRPSLDAMTAEPPAVSVEPPIVVSGVREPAPSREPFFPVLERAASTLPPAVVASGIRDQEADPYDSEPRESSPTPPPASARALPSVIEGARVDVTENVFGDREKVVSPAADIDPDIESSPSTLRSPSSVTDLDSTVRRTSETGEPLPEVRSPSALDRVRFAGRFLGDRTVRLAPVAGIALGVLSVVVSLAGEPASALRLPLALSAAVIVLGHRVLRFGAARPRGEPSPLVVVAPLAVASTFAIVSAVVHDVHADAHANFVGLAAASALTVEILLSRARRDVVAARSRTASALAVSARVVRGDAVIVVDVSLVKPGEQVVVESGETIPVDGVVTTGDAEVVPWFDSPALLQKKEGDSVVAGATVVSGRLLVSATFSGNERAWLRLAPSVGTSLSAGSVDVAAPLVAFVRRMVERGAPVSGLLVAGAVYADNGTWLDVVLAGCGGTFALAAVAAVSAAGLAHACGHVSAQRRGIVYKDAAAFDAAARVDVAVVCSRGTILLGEPEIVVVEAIKKESLSSKDGGLPSRSDSQGIAVDPSHAGGDAARVLAIAAGAETSSTHPFASAILHEARARGVRPDTMRSGLGHSGLGVTALAENGDRVIVGSRAFLLQEKVSVAIADARTSELEAQGRSVLLVAVAGRLIGLLALQDGLRPGARAAIQRMHDARIEPVLLSGEARDTCETIARALDIEHVRPEILPSDRGAEVRALADGGRVVAALGHTSSDDGALGAADVAVAMEAAGHAPGEWAVSLASDDVRDAALSLTIPRACRDRARTAVIIGGLTQAFGALGVAFGILPPAVVPVASVVAITAMLSIVRAREGEGTASLPDA